MVVAFHIVLAETRKNLTITWYYKFNLVMQLVALSTTFLFLVFFLGGGKLDGGKLSTALLGYIVWFYAVKMIGTVGIELVAEAQTGTLEQMCMSVRTPVLLLVGRALSALASTTALVALLDLVLWASTGTAVPVSAGGLLLFAVTLVGLFGFGLLIGAATLIYKHVHALSNLIMNMIIFTNGTLMSVNRFPHWLAAIANGLPSTRGVALLRESALDGRSLASMWTDGGLPNLLLNSAVYALLGGLAFHFGLRRARGKGSLGQY